MEKLKKYLFCTVLTGTLILLLVVSAGNWIVNAGNDGKALEDYTTPTEKTYYDTDYYEADHLFGAAGHFHLFASDKVTLRAHCNGNFAVPSIDIGANTGTNQVDTENSGEREISYTDKMKHNGLEIKTADLALGKKNTSVTDMNGNALSPGPISGSQIKVNNATFNIKDYQKIYLAPDKFIDFKEEFTYLRNVSAALTELDTTLKKGEKVDDVKQAQVGTYNLEDNNKAYIYLADGVNVLNCTLSEVSAAGSLYIEGMLCNKSKVKENHSFTGTQSLMINVDCKGATTASPGLETRYFCQCTGEWPHGHGEDNYYPGTIVVWNFYDSSKTDKIYTGTISPSKVIDGCYLAPNADIVITQNANGTLIGKEVTIASGESHRADFMGKKPALNISSVTPTKKPSATPKPTTTPDTEPSAKPSVAPSTEPTVAPSNNPVETASPTNTPAVPKATETPATQTPKETPQPTAPSKTTAPNQPTASEAAPTVTPKKETKDPKTPSGKNNKKSPQKGNLHITVTDSKTGAVVPNATVKITKPNGKVKTYTTDKNGQIKLNKTAVGKYKGVVTKVPKGYHADRTKFTSKVKAATTTKEKVKIKNAVSAGRKTNTTTSKVSSNTATNTSQPQTGDNFDVRIPIALFLLAFIGIITAIILKKKSYYYYN